MKTYAALSRIFPRSYRAKLLAVVLVCVCMPMLVLVSWLIAGNGMPSQRLVQGIVAGLSAAVAGTGLALILISNLLEPLRRAIALLDAYEHDQALPAAPDKVLAQDEMARLLRGIHNCLHSVDAGLRKLERHAMEDSLTQAMNRRGSSRALRASVTAAGASGDPFVLLVVDLDNLKAINDEHGHAAGDYALVSLVKSAHECCVGASDWIGRWGGDEFLLGIHADSGVAMDRVRLWIEVLARPEKGILPVHVSVGAADLEPGIEAAELYRRADAAMYRAKFAGGRRLVAHCSQEQRLERKSVA